MFQLFDETKRIPKDFAGIHFEVLHREFGVDLPSETEDPERETELSFVEIAAGAALLTAVR